MDISAVLVEIFSEYPSLTNKLGAQVESLTLSEHLHEVTQWLKAKASDGNEEIEEQEDPAKTILKKDSLYADQLLRYLVNLSQLISRSKNSPDGKSSQDAVFMAVAALVVEELAPLLADSYIVEDELFFCVRNMCAMRSEKNQNIVIHPGLPDSTLGTFLTLLWTYMEPDEIKAVLLKLINLINRIYKETPIDLVYWKQRRIIVVLTCICNHPETRKYLLLEIFFEKNCLPVFFYVQPPDETALKRFLPDDDTWWWRNSEFVRFLDFSDHYLVACNRLIPYATTLYTLQKNLIAVLLNHRDGRPESPSSRRIFITKFRNYVMENSTSASPTQPAVAFSFLCILLDVTRQLLATEQPEKPTQVDPVNFYNDAFSYFHVDRIGGDLLKLKQAFRSEMIKVLGESHPAILPLTPEESRQDLLSVMIMIPGHQPNQTFRNLEEQDMDRNSNQSLDELLDSLIIYYYGVAHKYIVQIRDLRRLVTDLTFRLTREGRFSDLSTEFLKNFENDKSILEIMERLFRGTNNISENTMKNVWIVAWYIAVDFGSYRRDLLCWLLKLILDTLQSASNQGVLFSFVLETYINVLPILLDIVPGHYRRDFTDYRDIVMRATKFLEAHSTDLRVVLAPCKDALLKGLESGKRHKVIIRALQKSACTDRVARLSILVCGVGFPLLFIVFISYLFIIS